VPSKSNFWSTCVKVADPLNFAFPGMFRKRATVTSVTPPRGRLIQKHHPGKIVSQISVMAGWKILGN
jgi:hypothetical protein